MEYSSNFFFFIIRLLKVLEDHGREDWILANLICQAIWNYCIESTNLHAALGPEVINRFIAILVDYIGKGITSDILYNK